MLYRIRYDGKYQKSFSCSKLSRIYSLFQFSSIAIKMDLKDCRLSYRSYFSVTGQDCSYGIEVMHGFF